MTTETRWVNFYPPAPLESAHPWRTTSWHYEDDAHANAREGRIACVQVTFQHGQGLRPKGKPNDGQ